MIKSVYLMKSLSNSDYKIGVSKNPKNRVKNIQTGNSGDIVIVDCYESEHAHKIEKTLQRRYGSLNKRGEWFKLSIENEVSFINECVKIEKNIDFLIENGNGFI